MILLSGAGVFSIFMFILFGLLFLILLPVFAVIDILRNNLRENDKVIWIIIIVFVPILGSVLYFFIGKNRK